MPRPRGGLRRDTVNVWPSCSEEDRRGWELGQEEATSPCMLVIEVKGSH